VWAEVPKNQNRKTEKAAKPISNKLKHEYENQKSKQGGKPLTDKAKLKGCFDCHAKIKDRDLVFTRYAP
jgi:hypothetical protein